VLECVSQRPFLRVLLDSQLKEHSKEREERKEKSQAAAAARVSSAASAGALLIATTEFSG
jgi:hypothetical protein